MSKKHIYRAFGTCAPVTCRSASETWQRELEEQVSQYNFKFTNNPVHCIQFSRSKEFCSQVAVLRGSVRTVLVETLAVIEQEVHLSDEQVVAWQVHDKVYMRGFWLREKPENALTALPRTLTPRLTLWLDAM